MASTARLSEWTQVTLDGSGNGTAALGPTGAGEIWTGVTVAVHCATNVAEAICRIYAGPSAGAASFADGTTWGSTGDSSDNMPPALPTGNQVFAVWTGGDAGTTAYLTVTGTRTVA